ASPFLNGFYYGYLATGDAKWVAMLVDWADSIIKRAVKEPDGYLGCPKEAGASTDAMPDFVTDNQLGEAMGLRPIVLIADKIRKRKARMRLQEHGKYYVWNYWDPAGPWDYKPDGSPRHWVGVHPNGGYYTIDVEGIVNAYEHRLVFTKTEIDRLIATNRDFMW